MRIPILAYHAVLPLPEGARAHGTVPLRAFREQVECLSRNGFSSLSLDQAADVLDGRGDAPRRPVVITFDDGYRCVIDHALPVLREAGFSAAMFVVTGAVGGTSDYSVARGGQEFEHAGWDELESAAGHGLEVGSHTVTHRPLADVDRREVEDELCRSREEIAARLGACAHFAYPYGSVPAASERLLTDCGYRTACTTEPGVNRPGRELTRLRRSMVGSSSGVGRWRGLRFRRKLGRWA